MAQTPRQGSSGKAAGGETDTAKTASAEATDPTASGDTASSLASVPVNRPIVIRLGKKKKRRRYSKGLKEIQQLERGVARASQRAGRAAEKGLREYRKRSNRSSRRRRDGSIRDAVKNWTRGLSEGVRVASNVPYDVVKPVSTRRITKQVRNTMRTVSPLFFR